MRIAVVVPPLRDFYLTPHRMSSLGASTILNLCRKIGHEAQLFIFPSKEKTKILPLPFEASYLTPYLVPGEFGPLSFFTRFKHYGPSFHECALAIAGYTPELVLISSFAYAYAEEAVSLAQALRCLLPHLVIAVGGAGPSACPEFYLEKGRASQAFDFVVTGEGEVTLPILLSAAHRKATLQPTLIQAERFTREEELSPSISIVKETKKEAWAAISLSRGCPVKCRFCSNWLCHGTRFRRVSLESVEKAVKQIIPEGLPVHLNFEDDNLLYDPPYFIEVLRLIQRIRPGVTFTAENGLDYRFLDPSFTETLIDLGFKSFNLSLGSIQPETAKRERRSVDLERYLEIIRILSNRGIPSITYFIAGLEGDKPDSVIEHLLFLNSLPTLAGISIYYPVPGLPNFNPPPPLLLSHPGLSRGSFAYPWTEALSTKELITAFRLARYVNLLKKAQKTPEDRSLVEKIQFTHRLHTLIKSNHTKEMVLVPADAGMERIFFKDAISIDNCPGEMYHNKKQYFIMQE
jgi:radical SAM superfamily enzyme YgiQ (UPF0313 family)